jgi:hypothetical protein
MIMHQKISITFDRKVDNAEWSSLALTRVVRATGSKFGWPACLRSVDFYLHTSAENFEFLKTIYV